MFTVDGLPIAKGRPRAFRVGNFIRHHTPKRTENYEAWVRGCAQAAMEGRNLLDGACRLDVAFYLPVPSSWPAWKQEAALEERVKPTGRPDLDNMLKAIKDACNGVVFRDDSQIVELTSCKAYGDEPEARVLITPLATIAGAAAWKEHKRRQAFVQEPADLFQAAE